MARTSLAGYQRQYGSGGKSATPSVGLQCVQFDFDPTQASASVSKTLPAGCIPLFAQVIVGGATGGASPTVDIGISGTTDGFADEAAANAYSGLLTTGSLMGTALTADTVIQAGVGASAATGGTVTVGIYYIMVDDGNS